MAQLRGPDDPDPDKVVKLPHEKPKVPLDMSYLYSEPQHRTYEFLEDQPKYLPSVPLGTATGVGVVADGTLKLVQAIADHAVDRKVITPDQGKQLVALFRPEPT